MFSIFEAISGLALIWMYIYRHKQVYSLLDTTATIERAPWKRGYTMQVLVTNKVNKLVQRKYMYMYMYVR